MAQLASYWQLFLAIVSRNALDTSLVGPMDDYEHFQQLALRPHTKTSLVLMSAATRVAHKRFQSCTSSLLSTNVTTFPPHQIATQEDVNESLRDLVGPVDEAWTELVSKLSQLKRPPEGSRVTQSMWQLVRGEHLDFGVVEDYLQLLRPTSHHVEIAPIRMLRHDQNCIQETEGIKNPIIIPFCHENNWAFAVAYSDCVHWYDSAPNSAELAPTVTGTRLVVEGWRGPQSENLADSSVFMLMGIKLILQRKPHLSGGVARSLSQSFRACLFIELLCHKVQPTSTDLRDINFGEVIETISSCSALDKVGQGHMLTDAEQESSFFEDAMAATISAAQDISHASPVICQAEEANASRRNPELPPATDPDGHLGLSSLQPQHPANTSRKRRSQPRVTNRRREGHIHQELDDRKIILGNLSHAIHFKRSAKVSVEDDPFVLWALLRYSRTSGNLHRRFHAVLFHQITEDNDRIRKMQSRMGRKGEMCMKRDLWSWKFWKRVSDIGVKHGLGPFVPLCAFRNDLSGYRLPMEAQDPLIQRFENRLQNESDMLRVWLQDARDLCEAILVGPTPVALFKIDEYDFQAEFDMTDDQFHSYVCTDWAQGSARQRFQ